MTPKLRYLAEHSFTGKSLGVNPEDKSGAGAPKAVKFCMHHRSGSYLVTALAPNRSSIIVNLDFVSFVECV